MTKKWMLLLLVSAYALNGYADTVPDITLTPREGFHKLQ